MDTDPTQVPPFGPVAVITDGTVTDIAGWANQFWIDEQNDAALVLAPEDTALGDLYDGQTFTRPVAEQPITQEDPDV